jgi:hypothetical protein
MGPMSGRAQFAVTTGTAPDYVAAFPTPIRTLKNGDECIVWFHAVNPTADNTFTPDGLETKPIKFGRPVRKIAPGRILQDMLAVLVFSEAADAWLVATPLPTVTKTISGTTYTLLEEDHGVMLVFTSATAVAVTVPQATLQFVAPFSFDFLVAGAGTVTFTPGTSTVNGAGTLDAKTLQGGTFFTDGGNYRARVSGAIGQTPYILGLGIANNVADANNDIDIAAGVARDAGDADFMVLATALTKRLDASWAVGTNQGGLFTGSKANSTAYHVFVIKRPDTGVVDAGFDTSITAANAPANYTEKRRLGMVVTGSDGNILGFIQRGTGNQREIFWANPIKNVDAANPGTSAVTRSLSVPPGLRVKALITVGLFAGTVQPVARISDLSLPDNAPSDVSTTPAGGSGGELAALTASLWVFGQAEVWTDTSSQVRSRLSASAATTRLVLFTRGWMEEI